MKKYCISMILFLRLFFECGYSLDDTSQWLPVKEQILKPLLEEIRHFHINKSDYYAFDHPTKKRTSRGF